MREGKFCRVLLVGLSATVFAAMPASATTVDFNDLGSEASYTYYGGSTLTTGGFNFSTSLGLESALIVWENGSSFDADGPGYSLNVAYPDSLTTITKSDGGLFDFTSIDLNHFTNNQVGGAGYESPFDVTFTFLDDLGSSTSTVTVNATPGFQTFAFGKTGLRAVQFVTATNSIQLDNVNFGGAVAAVPEPATWAMMIVGFGAVGGAIRRRKVAPVATA